LGPKFLLPLEEILGRSSCLPGRKMDRAFLLALEEGSWVRFLLALEEGLGSARSCLPGRRFGCEALPALEEDGPSVFACPGGEEGRDLGRLLVGGRVLLALEESGLCALACLGGGTGGMSCLPGRRLGVPAGLSSSRVGRVGDGVGCGAWRALCWEKDANKEDDIRKVEMQYRYGLIFLLFFFSPPCLFLLLLCPAEPMVRFLPAREEGRVVCGWWPGLACPGGGWSVRLDRLQETC
jgi:hypothetical protein